MWYDAKAWIASYLGVTNDQIHVHAGLAVFLGVLLLMRRRRGAPIVAWLAVLAFEVANEALDARDWIHWTGTVNWAETARDMGATLFWPTVLMLLARRLGLSRGAR